MKKTKLTELLSDFSNSEIKRFNLFLNSPYFNSKPHFINLFNALVKFHPQYENQKLTEENLFKEVFPDKSYSYTQFKNQLSDLYELAKTFLTFEEISDDKLIMKNYLMLNLFNRNIPELTAKELNIAEELHEKEKLNPAFFEYNYLFKKNLCSYYSINDRDKFYESCDVETDTFYSMILKNLLSYELFYEAMVVDTKQRGNSEANMELVEKAYKVDRLKRPVTEILYKTLQLLRTDDEKYFFEIWGLLLNVKEEFLNNNIKLWVYQPMEAFLIKRVRHGETKFHRPQFELYKHCFETGVFDYDYGFAQGKLLVTVEPAVRVKEFEWIENQINKFRELGPKEIREEYYNFNMAKVLHAKGQNEKSLEFLNKINPEITVIKSMVRNMQMKVYYDLGYYELAKSQIDAYRHYIVREKEFSPVYVESVLNFLSLYNRLIDIKLDNNKDKIIDFEYDVGKTQNIILREWLKEKTEELK